MKKEVLPQLKDWDKKIMENILAAGKIEHKFAVRIQTVLHRADGKPTNSIAEFFGIIPSTVSNYVKRYNSGGVEALIRDKTRKPGKEPISAEKKTELIKIVCTEKPKAATHWSVRSLAKRLGIGKSSVNTILRENGLKPHISQKFGFSTDKQFEEKLKDVVGLYMNPPDNAIILCVDEKSQIQALERSQPILPMFRNVPERQTADYHRNGTTTLFAALDVLTGKVIGDCKDRHTAKEYLSFLKKLNRECEKGRVLHIIADNYSTHKTKEVKEYLEKHKDRFVTHFIPTHSSWLNLVERWFAEITNKRIRRESWSSVAELIDAIKIFIKDWNKTGKPFIWKKTADNILTSIEKLKTGYAI
ncbi:IS630 family transposase [Spirochaetia bacterium]|nr:IS630 family transposase [Spirochaetia bacterium]